MSKESKSGLGLSDAYTILFVGLKLHHDIDWSWLWVLSPTWIAFIINVIVAVYYKNND